MILIGADGGKWGGPVRAAEGVAEAAQIYAKRKDVKHSQDAQDRELADHEHAQEQSAQLAQRADARAEKDQAAQDALAPINQKIAEQTLRSHTSANDAQAAWDARQKKEQDFEDQVNVDSARQEQAQQYKRMTGEDVPDSYWNTDAQGHAVGTPGWHWTQYDPRSPIPIKVQLGFHKAMTEAASLPPGATRDEKIAAARHDAHNAVVEDAKQSILGEVSQHVQPPPDQSGKQAEPDPSRYVPPETFKQIQDMVKDPTSNPDEVRKKWDTVQKSHAQELANNEDRAIQLEGLDLHAQRIAEQQAQYGDISGHVDPQAFVAFRTMRHLIEDKKLSGPALHLAVATAKGLLTPGPKPPKDQGSGLTPGKALELAMTEAADPLSPLSAQVKASPDKRDAIITQRARTLLDSASALTGKMPGAGANPSGAPTPNSPEVQAKAAEAVARATGESGGKVDVDSLAKKAAAAGWTKPEFVEFGKTGKAPAGKPPIQ